LKGVPFVSGEKSGAVNGDLFKFQMGRRGITPIRNNMPKEDRMPLLRQAFSKLIHHPVGTKAPK